MDSKKFEMLWYTIIIQEITDLDEKVETKPRALHNETHISKVIYATNQVTNESIIHFFIKNAHADYIVHSSDYSIY
jgi:hypothetical protein